MPINKAGRFTYQKQYSRWDIMQAQRSVPCRGVAKLPGQRAGCVVTAAERLFQPDHRLG